MGQRPRPWFERSGRAARFAQDPSGPQAHRAIIDHVLITVTDVIYSLSINSLNGYIGDVKQFTATAYGSRGQVVSGAGVTWRSDNATVVSITSAGVATFNAAGSATITASVDGRDYATAAVSSQAPDGSYADVIFAAANDGVPILRFRSARVATTSVNGVETVPQVPGMPAGGALTAYGNGGAVQRPSYDSTNKLARTNAAASTSLVSTWTGDADINPAQGIYKAFIGAFVSTDDGAKVMGIQRGSNINENASLFKSFADPHLTAQLNTPGPNDSSTWPTNWSCGNSGSPGPTTLRLYLWRIPTGNGVLTDSLNSSPWATTEIVGVEGSRALPHGAINSNIFKPYASASYREYFGGEPFGAVGSPGINNGDVIYGDDLTFGAQPTANVIAALKRYFAARPGTVAQASTIQHHVVVVGDSRPRGNGASNLAHALPAQLQTALGSNYQGDNRGIAGDNLDNVLIDPYLTNRIGYFYDPSRAWDWLVFWAFINSVKDTTNYAPDGMDGATAAARLTSWVNRVRAIYPDATKVKILVCHETGSTGLTTPQSTAIAAYNAAIDAMKVAGTIQQTAAIETGTDVLDFADTNDYIDGLHPGDGIQAPSTVNVVGEIATVIKNAIVAAGG